MGTDLRERVAERAAGDNGQPGGEVAKRPKTVVDLVREMEPQFRLAMPKGAESAQLVRDILTLISKTPKLRECVPATVLGGAMTMAQLGLRPGVLGHGWLLPFWDRNHLNPDGSRGAHKAQLVIGYKGYLELISRSARVSAPGAHEVYSNDIFELGYRDGRRIFTHEVNWWGDRGALLGWYAAAQEHGADVVTVTDPWSVEKMNGHRDRFAMARKGDKIVGPWADHFESMARKTMLLRLADMLPKSTELQTALDADGGVRLDLTPQGIEHSERVIDGEVESDVMEPDAGEPGGAPVPAAPAPPPAGPKANQGQLKRIHGLLKDMDITSDAGIRDAIGVALGLGGPIKSRRDLLRDQADVVIAHLEKVGPPPPGDEVPPPDEPPADGES